MEKKYVTARLFKHNRASDCLITEEELHDSDQEHSIEALDDSLENNESVESCTNPEFSLPQRLLNFIQRALVLLGLDHKG